jgi:hypothetical protein
MSGIKLGSRVKDRVSGFVGIATARTMHLNGCVRYAVDPPVDNKGKIPDSYYFDEAQLEVIDVGISEGITPQPTGGPRRDQPSRRSTP